MVETLRSTPLAWWVVASVTLYVVAANLSWRVRGWTEGSAARLQPALRWLSGGAPAATGSFLFNIGVPYAALLLGMIDTRTAGLAGFDWSATLSGGVAIGLATAALLAVHERRLGAVAPARETQLTGSLAACLWHALFVQAHLGFYRAVCIVTFGAYSGVWLALALVIGEWLLAPAWRAAWRSARGQRVLSFDLALALTASVLFLYTGNLWPGAALHAVVALVFRVQPVTAMEPDRGHA